MKHKFIAASLLLAFTAPAWADQGPPQQDNRQGPPSAEQILKRLDTNGDGVIEENEFKFPGDRIIKRADLNGDGAVTLEEMHQHFDQMMAKREAKMKDRDAKMRARMDRMFKSMDTNGDGKVTMEEANAAAFKRMDKNHDGVLEADELTRPQHRHWRHHRPKGDAPPPDNQ